MKNLMQKKNLNILIIFIISILSNKILSAEEDLKNSNNEIQTISNTQQEQNVVIQKKDFDKDLTITTNADDNNGFEKVPVTTVYGPIGIALKIIEISLQRLYILFEL